MMTLYTGMWSHKELFWKFVCCFKTERLYSRSFSLSREFVTWFSSLYI